jgi:hypothetical protein
LRDNSRVTVEQLTPIDFAIAFLLIPVWSKTFIAYLCSEVNCLYISNAKLINPGEISVSPLCFLHYLLSPLSGGFAPPAARATTAVFFIVL